jgi:hypothetical protein
MSASGCFSKCSAKVISSSLIWRLSSAIMPTVARVVAANAAASGVSSENTSVIACWLNSPRQVPPRWAMTSRTRQPAAWLGAVQSSSVKPCAVVEYQLTLGPECLDTVQGHCCVLQGSWDHDRGSGRRRGRYAARRARGRCVVPWRDRSLDLLGWVGRACESSVLRSIDIFSAWRLLPDIQVGIAQVPSSSTREAMLELIERQAIKRVGVSPQFHELTNTAQALRYARVAFNARCSKNGCVTVFDNSVRGPGRPVRTERTLISDHGLLRLAKRRSLRNTCAIHVRNMGIVRRRGVAGTRTCCAGSREECARQSVPVPLMMSDQQASEQFSPVRVGYRA